MARMEPIRPTKRRKEIPPITARLTVFLVVTFSFGGPPFFSTFLKFERYSLAFSKYRLAFIIGPPFRD